MSSPLKQDVHGAAQGNPACVSACAVPAFQVPFPSPVSDVHMMVQQLAMNVQKLQRSKGQMSKDLSEMLREAQDLNMCLHSRTSSRPAATDQAVDIAEARAPDADWRGGPPPGLSPDSSGPLQHIRSQLSAEQVVSHAGCPSLPLPEAIQVQEKTINGDIVYRIEWHIRNAKSKLKDCIGRPLVSPEFEAAGLAEMRLLLLPNIDLDALSTIRDRKTKIEEVVVHGPLQGVLKFKAVGGEGRTVNFSAFVGSKAKGPVRHNFSENIMKVCDFDNDWLQEMHQGTLVVGVEILNVFREDDSSDDEVTIIEEVL